MKNLILYLPVLFTVLLFQNSLQAQCNMGDLNAQNMAISPGNLYSCGKVTLTTEWLQQAQVAYDADFHQSILIVSLPNEFQGTTGKFSITATDGNIYWNTSRITISDNEIKVPLQGLIPSGEGLSIILSDMDIVSDAAIISDILHVSQSISNVIADCKPTNDEQFMSTYVRSAEGPIISDIQPDCSEGQLAINLSATAGRAMQDKKINRYSWTGPNGFSSSDEDPSISVSSYQKNKYAGTYHVTVTDGNGCRAASSIELDGENCETLKEEEIDIDVRPGRNVVRFGWRILGGLASSLFSLERSEDGQTYTKIGEIQGNAIKSQSRAYELTDYNPLSGENYYRLKQVKQDGTIKYSNIEPVSFSKSSDLTVYPNPVSAGSEINLRGQKIESVKVYNMLGQLIITKTFDEPRTNITIPSGNLEQGMYITRVNDKLEKRVIVN